MYNEDTLRRYPFFRELLDTTGISHIHDSLTGLLARPHILRFIRRLIQDGTPFAMAILDLDSFKSVNDNYGHTIGDAVLSGVAADLQAYLGDNGVAGRFGGDEFLVVYFGNLEYEPLHSFFLGMVRGGTVFRRIHNYGGIIMTITATMGIARFPLNADSFEKLFSTADKALYRGKSKGRNCFIIYVPEKHGHMEIPALARNSLYEIFYKMASEFEKGGSLHNQLFRAFMPMRTAMHMTRLFYVDVDGVVWDPASGGTVARTEKLDTLLSGGMYAPSTLDRLKQAEPELFQTLTGLGIESVLIARIGGEKTGRGYLMACPEEHNMRVWQDEDCTALFFLSRMADDVLRRQ